MLLSVVEMKGFSFILLTMLVSGMMLIFVDFIQRKKYISFAGAVLIIGGLTGYMISAPDISVLFWLITAICSVLMLVHLLMLYLTKREWIKKYSIKTEDQLLGMEGIATTTIDGTGHMIVADTNVLVSSSEVIEQGERVKIVGIENGNFVVEKLPSDGNAEQHEEN